MEQVMQNEIILDLQGFTVFSGIPLWFPFGISFTRLRFAFRFKFLFTLNTNRGSFALTQTLKKKPNVVK